MMEFLEDVLIPVIAIVAVFGTLFGGFYVWITRRHAERVALIERGHAGALAPDPRATLRTACVATGLGLGLLAGWALVELASVPGYVAYLACAAVGVGLGLVVFLRAGGGEARA